MKFYFPLPRNFWNSRHTIMSDRRYIWYCVMSGSTSPSISPSAVVLNASLNVHFECGQLFDFGQFSLGQGLFIERGYFFRRDIVNLTWPWFCPLKFIQIIKWSTRYTDLRLSLWERYNPSMLSTCSASFSRNSITIDIISSRVGSLGDWGL